jgi:CheY-like chemotaxis protein
MSTEVRERAFEPFYTTKGPGQGSGLGLSMIYGFVKQSGGHVQLYSEPGRGTTVRILLPAQASDALRKGKRLKPIAAGKVNGETILVAEDDPRVRRVSVRRLQDLGYRVIEVDNGPAALEVLRREGDVDLLFTDVVMPGGMSGIDLARKAREFRPALKVVFTSGYAEQAIIESGMPTVQTGWLAKPYNSRDLAAKMRELLDA